MSRLQNIILLSSVFIAGAAVMAFELAGSRLLGPYLGNSIVVWASLIGIILGSLSLGYWLGGRLADKKTNLKTLSSILLLSAIAVGITALIRDLLLVSLLLASASLELNSVVASLVLFAPTSILLGMVTPYAIRLKLKDLQTSGTTVGNLYAISTIGSITGTFLAGFYILPQLGSNTTLIITAIALVAASLSLLPHRPSKTGLLLLIGLLIFSAVINIPSLIFGQQNVIDVDTVYSRAWIYDSIDADTDKPIRVLHASAASQSAMFLEDDDLVFPYSKFYRLIKHFKPDIERTLIIGGAGYSYPKDYLSSFNAATLDVVELDPGFTQLARDYFNLRNNPRLTIYHEDGRTYLNRSHELYDAVLLDAFGNSYAIPFQLTTHEATQRLHDLLEPGGLVMVNVISAIAGDEGRFLRALHKTYSTVFEQVYVFPVDSPSEALKVQNIVLVALKSSALPKLESPDPELNSYLKNLYTGDIPTNEPILTDDRAPVELLVKAATKKIFRETVTSLTQPADR